MGSGPVFLFTDVEGSTRLWERAPDRMGAALARHDALLREAVARHGGHVFKTVGDGVCAVFEDADGALAAALEAQRRVRRERWPVGPLSIRASLHAGPAEERDGDFFGTTLNRAARLLDLAHGGQVLLSGTVRGALTALPDGATLRDLGEHRLRDLTHPEHVHQLDHADLPADFAPLRALDAQPHNLPLQLTAFLGRERELAEVDALLRRAPLVTLAGAGGCGKTRLGLQTAADTLPRFSAGAWLVELAGLGDDDLVVRAVAAALDVAPAQGTPLIAQVAERIGDGTLLLVLDNCEHLLDGAADVAHDLLRRCPRLRILATSREPLRVHGEAVYPVGPLGLPAADAAPGEVAAAPACRLFLELARAAGHAFDLDGGGMRRVAAICRALDGIPLALEFAAACTRRMDLAAIEEGLARRFDLLRRGRRSALPHHRTLEATLDWSYELLEEDERALLRRLSVFSGGWTLASLKEVCGARAGGAHDRLLDHSLVERRGARYRFLETVRAYAAARLEEAPEEERGVRARHARFVAGLVKASRDALYREDARAVADGVEAEIDNVRAALAWMLSAPDHFEEGLRTATAFWTFCWMRGYMPEGRRWIERYLDHPAAEAAPAPVLGHARYAAGVLAKECGDLAAARRHYEAGLALHESHGVDDTYFASTLSALANVVRSEGDLDRAQALYERSVALHRESGHRANEAGALDGLGRVAQLRGRLAEARAPPREPRDLPRVRRPARPGRRAGEPGPGRAGARPVRRRAAPPARGLPPLPEAARPPPRGGGAVRAGPARPRAGPAGARAAPAALLPRALVAPARAVLGAGVPRGARRARRRPAPPRPARRRRLRAGGRVRRGGRAARVARLRGGKGDGRRGRRPRRARAGARGARDLSRIRAAVTRAPPGPAPGALGAAVRPGPAPGLLTNYPVNIDWAP